MWLHICPSSPVSEQLTSDSALPNHGYELWVTSSGTPLQRPFSWRGWKNRPWIKLLSGTTLPPSQASSTAERWISSLPASRANRSASPGSVRASPTTGGSGLSSPTPSTLFNPDEYSLRTSQDSSTEASKTFSADSMKWGSMRNGVCSQRPKWEPPISADGSSSWPTPTASHYGTNKGGRNPNGKTRPSLHQLANKWPTPAASDGSRGPDLARANREGSGAPDLVTYASRLWAAPASPDTDSLRHRTMEAGGGNGSSKPVLNPEFVEALMGLPIGWTDFEPLATQPYRSVLPLRTET